MDQLVEQMVMKKAQMEVMGINPATITIDPIVHYEREQVLEGLRRNPLHRYKVRYFENLAEFRGMGLKVSGHTSPAMVSVPNAVDEFEHKREMLVKQAEKWVGIKERGKNRGKEVEMFQKEVDGKAQGEPWCLSFVQYCVNQVDRDLAGKGNRNTANNLYKTEHCLTCWHKTSVANRIEKDQLQSGMIVIWQYFRNGHETASGHVGIVKEILNDDEILTIEGNTSDRNSIIREGEGVFEMNRKLKYDGNFRVKGFLTPWVGQPGIYYV
jgi:hypothetical protein